MSFEEFQKHARLYVIGALENGEYREFEKVRRHFGARAENFITECYRLNAALALSLRPAKSSDALKERLMKMVRERKQRDAH